MFNVQSTRCMHKIGQNTIMQIVNGSPPQEKKTQGNWSFGLMKFGYVNPLILHKIGVSGVLNWRRPLINIHRLN